MSAKKKRKLIDSIDIILWTKARAFVRRDRTVYAIGSVPSNAYDASRSNESSVAIQLRFIYTRTAYLFQSRSMGKSKFVM